MKWFVCFAVALCTLAASPSAAQHYSRTFDDDFPSTIYSHNDSVMELRMDGGLVEITYLFPRPGLPETVGHKTMLFTGNVDPQLDRSGNIVRYTNRVQGIAYIFSSQCGAFAYQVRGTFTPDLEMLVLSGAAPIIDAQTCGVAGYSQDSFNARLIFHRDRRPITE